MSPPMAMVWACSLSLEGYRAAGRAVAVPRPACGGCGAAMVFWSGYERSVRVDGRCQKVWFRRCRCGACGVSHALVPAFCLVGRLDVVDAVGEAVTAVVEGPGGVRPVADRLGVPYTTARGWLRRFGARAAMLAAGFAALGVEFGGVVPELPGDVGRAALMVMCWAWGAAVCRAGGSAGSRWGFVSLVTGGLLLAANTDPPWPIFGRRRLMPPVP